MPHSEDKTLNNWLIQVVAPVLIMLMVGSLVFFFVEILYRGPHTARLCWVLGLFTVASVLVSRVSIKEGSERAALFGLALAGATFVTSMVIVDFDYAGLSLLEPLVLLVLIGTVMWTAGKLTWDCTVVDSSRDVSASGLLVVVRRRFFKTGIVSDYVAPPDFFSKSERQPVSEQSNSQLGRGMFSRLFTPVKSQNTPGLWVFYFSLFALPVFGVGQWFVSSARQSGFGWVLVLFSIYLGSGLSLLMVTSLLGLDRYVSRRNLDIPLPIARSWLTIGALFA